MSKFTLSDGLLLLLLGVFILNSSVAAQPNPDLVVSGFSVEPASLYTGDSLEVFALISDGGDTTAQNSSIGYLLSTNPTISINDLSLDLPASPTLVPGQTSSADRLLTVSADPGLYRVGMSVDEISNELNASNNCSGGSMIGVTGNYEPVATDNCYTQNEDTLIIGNVITDYTGVGVEPKTISMENRTVSSDDESEAVFNTEIIAEVWLDIPVSSWTPIDDVALAGCGPHPRSYYPGKVKIGGIDFPGSGVRVKGGCGSSRELDSKAAFKANFSWDDPAVPGCPPIRRYKGLKKITLNNQVEDASYTHERIGYDFFQKLGIPVPRVAPVRVYVNKQLWGLYLNVETIDRHFLARHFDSEHGMLYEADYGCDIGEESCFEAKFDTDDCDDPLVGDPTDMTPLQRLNTRLAQMPRGSFYPAIDQIIDFDAYLTTWAAASIMGYWDGYPNDPNNYRIYHNPTDDRWTLIPTGIDQLFEENVAPFNPVGMLSKRCLANKDCKAAFRSKLAKLIDIFEDSDYPTMARAIENQIRTDVEADPRKEISVEEWHTAVNSTIQYMQRRPGELRDLLSRSEKEKSGPSFYFHALTDPGGERFIFVSWLVPEKDSESEYRWLTAKGYFEGLSAEIDALELIGGGGGGVKIGTVTVDFVDCQTAMFHYLPDDDGLKGQSITSRIDSEIWKYCE